MNAWIWGSPSLCVKPKAITYVRLPPMTGPPSSMSARLSYSTGWAFIIWPEKSVRWRGETAMERRPTASKPGYAGSEMRGEVRIA